MPAMEVAEHEAERECNDDRQCESGAGQLELLECLLEQEAGVISDELDRVDEGMRVGGIRKRHATPFAAHGARARFSATSKRSHVSANATARAPAE